MSSSFLLAAAKQTGRSAGQKVARPKSYGGVGFATTTRSYHSGRPEMKPAMVFATNMPIKGDLFDNPPNPKSPSARQPRNNGHNTKVTRMMINGHTTSNQRSISKKSLSALAAAVEDHHETPVAATPPTTPKPLIPKLPKGSITPSYPKLASSLASSSSSKINIMESLQDDTEVDMVELKRLASLTPTPLRLGDMYKYAASADRTQRLRNAQFLHRELPIRLAQRAYDLLALPHGLSEESKTIRKVALMYIHYIQQYQAMPSPTNEEEEDQFTEMLHSMVLDRTSVPATMAKALHEWLADERKEDTVLDRQQEIEDALQRFFTARVGLRFLTEHHILSSPNPKLAGLRQMQTQCDLGVAKEQDRGCIQHDCSPVLECQKVAQEVARQTHDCYGICPEIEIVDRQSTEAQVFTYVPHHLHYMLAELLKNSCRASVVR